ncbi:hypothetical protein ACQPUY_08120 [Clostridium nigeriense]|uniref:hypothetical protein n=1 Tax=Clostridium nigeriense TaxID=1805470 RepID=UPI003D342494
MKKIEDDIRKIEEEISETKIILPYGVMSITLFDLEQYEKIIVNINREREKNQNLEFRKSLIKKYKFVFLSKKRKLNKILNNLKNNKVEFVPKIESVVNKEYLQKFHTYREDISLKENSRYFLRQRINCCINKVNEELFLLNFHPSLYMNSMDEYIGGDFRYRYDAEAIIYEDVNILQSESHHFAIYTNEKTKEKTKRDILNILAYLNGTPIFLFTQNPSFNRKIDDLYQQFDLLDMLRLRKNEYFKEETEESISLQLPILKNYNNYSVVLFKTLKHAEIVDLYHSSLKQFEPLPRCVFLYRVFEYAASVDYKVKIRPTEYKQEDAIEYYIEKAIGYNPNPLYYMDFGSRKVTNYFTKLKLEARKIFKEWSEHPYKKSKTRGEIIYNIGRNLVAHGGNGEHNMKYDYDKNYKHINDVNIILELIARYVIELLNPGLKNVVERRKIYYEKQYTL